MTSLSIQMRFISLILLPGLVSALFYASGYGSGNDFPSPNNSQLPWLDFGGRPTTNDSLKVALPYGVCMQQTARPNNWKFISWNMFGTSFGTWLLPWLALTGELYGCFGSCRI
jgi:hypothetical protein